MRVGTSPASRSGHVQCPAVDGDIINGVTVMARYGRDRKSKRPSYDVVNTIGSAPLAKETTSSSRKNVYVSGQMVFRSRDLAERDVSAAEFCHDRVRPELPVNKPTAVVLKLIESCPKSPRVGRPAPFWGGGGDV